MSQGTKLPQHEYRINLTRDNTDGKWLIVDGHVRSVGDMRPSDFKALMQALMTHSATMAHFKGWEKANWYHLETRWYYLSELQACDKIVLYDSREQAERAREVSV